MSEWRNWANTESCECTLVRPACLEELQAEVRRAVERGQRIRAAGGSYSWAPLVKNEGGAIIELGRLNRVLRVDPEAEFVEVECGMTIQELTRVTHENGLTLITPTLFPYPSIGGTIAPGCHGTGWKSGNFSDQIIEMTIVKADGSLATVGRGDPDFYAAIVNLGTFGIVYSIKLRVAKEFNVYTDKRLVSVETVLEEFDDLQASYEYLEMMWFPLEKKIWLYLMNPTESRADPKTWWGELKRGVNTWLENTAGGKFVPWVAQHVPQFTPELSRLASGMSNTVEASVMPASEAFHFQRAYPKCVDTSYAVPAEEAKRAWSEAIELVEQYASASLYPINLAMHCRFTGSSRAWLAPDYNRRTLYIEAATARATPHWEGFFRQLEDRWFAIEGARPHWSKIYFKAEELAARYPRMNAFLDARQRWDPDRTFLNPFLEEKVFKLPRPGAAAALTGVEPLVAPARPLGSPHAGD